MSQEQKLFEDMSFIKKLDHIERCQVEAARCIRVGEPSNLADIADHIDYWGPWMLGQLRTGLAPQPSERAVFQDYCDALAGHHADTLQNAQKRNGSEERVTGDDTLCPTCGSPVRVEGRTTMYYVPINAHDRSYIKALLARDKARTMAAELAGTMQGLADMGNVAAQGALAAYEAWRAKL